MPRAKKPKENEEIVLRSIRFYRLLKKPTKEDPSKRPNMQAILKHIADKPWRDQEWQRTDGNAVGGWFERLDRRPYTFELGSIQAKDKPICVSRKNGRRSTWSSQSEDDPAVSSHYAVFDHPKGEVLGVASGKGPRGGSAISYLKACGNEEATRIDIRGVMAPGTEQIVKALKKIKRAKIRILVEDLGAAGEPENDAEADLVDQLRAVAATTPSEKIALEVVPQQSKIEEFVANVLAAAAFFTGIDRVGRDAPVVQLIGSSPKGPGDVPIDLLSHLLLKHEPFVKLKDKDGKIDSSDAFGKIEGAYHDSMSVITESFSE